MATQHKLSNYHRAQQAIVKIIQRATGETPSKYVKSVETSARQICDALSYDVVKSVNSAIIGGYGDAKSIVGRNVKTIIGNKRGDETFTQYVDRIYKNIDSDLNKAVRHNKLYPDGYVQLGALQQGFREGVRTQLNDALVKMKERGTDTVQGVKNYLTEELKKTGPKINIDGRNYDAEGYASMLGRTARMETANRTMLSAGQKLGTDLVVCIGQDVTCKVCSQYRNKVYSVSGKDKRFTPLRGGKGSKSPLGFEYDTIHPNCRCEFIPWFEEFHSDEIDKLSKQSLSPLKDERSEWQRDEYQVWQDKNRQLYAEEKAYFGAKQLLGKDMPYKTLGAFRRSYRTENGSAAYNKSHNIVRDNNYFTAGKDFWVKNGVKTLEDYQQLRYNDSAEFKSKST